MENTPETTGLSPEEYERRKSADARVEDIAYTINHSLVCSAVDVLGTPVSSWAEKTFGWSFGHDHGGHGHEGNFVSWLVGEIIGDYAAVPVTVAFQRWAPGFMGSLRLLMEPALGPLFRMGARHSAQRWAAQRGFAADSSQARERERQIYEHEVRHLPQALMWTASSTAINLAMQYGIERNKLFGTHMHGNFTEWLWGKGVGKLAASALTAGAVVGFRGVTPQTAEHWDAWTSKNVFLPLTEKAGHLFGVNKEDVERMSKKKEAAERGDWVERTKEGPGADTGRSIG